ncbi:MAG TPA: phytanoyl-CoA dioxygenase family protein [Reyranella sp.]|jgi:ectoine hydroxylase-related dioxygenase (phytanoyl-CoA dioxygenase family)
MPRLNPSEVEAFQRDGYYAPVDVFSLDEARRWRADLEAFERTLPPGPVSAGDRRKLHVRCPWARDLVEDPRLLDVMESLLGPDILVYTSTFFIKEPNTDAITAWHQDATFFGLSPHEHVTAWVALSEASIEAGCMEFIPGSHRWGQLTHGQTALPGTINAGARSISAPMDKSTAVFAPVKTGQVSLHHTLIAHNSPPNRSNDRRIGLGISYIPAHCQHSGSKRMSATLVRGTDRYGHFDLEDDTRTLSAEAQAEAHARAYGRYRECHAEQAARYGYIG